MSAGRIEALIATKGLAIVRKLARKFATSNDVGLDESDFVSLGQAKLVQIAPSYEEARAVQFTTYIFPHVRGAMQDAVRRKRHELTVHSLIEREIEHETRCFWARQTDEFEIVFDEPEVIRTRFEEHLSDLAMTYVTRAAGAVVRMMRSGTEDHLGELQEHALIADVITRTVAELPERLQRLWQVHYVEGRPLKDYAGELELSDATAGRDHKAFRDALQQALIERGVRGLPDVA